jgi:hypothetical protein
VSAAWNNTGSCSTAVDQSTAVTLQNGKVLKIGGNFSTAHLTVVCELYDPNAGTWSDTGSLHQARSNAMAVVLNDGTVLCFGGSSGDTTSSVRSTAEIYDPGTGLWSTTGSMSVARVAAGYWLLANGTVLVAGGTSGGGGGGFLFSGPSLSSAEIYDPNTGLWTATGALNTARQFFGYALSGTTPVAVGGAGPTPLIIVSTETFSSGSWTSKTDCPVSGTFNDGFNNCVSLNDETVLLASGRTVYYGAGTDTGNCAVYDAGSDTWTTVDSLHQKRDEGALFLLNNGKVLMAGGFTNNDSVFLSQCEVYDPNSQAWTVTASLPDAKGAIFINVGPVLQNGKALIACGFSQASGDTSVTAELYTPGSLPPMSITLLQHVLVSSGGHTITVSPTTAGSLMVVCALGFTGVSDNVNGAYTLVPGTDAADANVFYFANSGAGATTITMTGSGYNGSASEWSGVKTISPIDVHAVLNNISGSTPTAAAVTTTNAGDLVLTFVVDDPDHAITGVSAGWTLIDYDSTASSVVAYQIPGATGTYAPQFTLTSGSSGFNTSTTAFFPGVTGPSAKRKSSTFLVF